MFADTLVGQTAPLASSAHAVPDAPGAKAEQSHVEARRPPPVEIVSREALLGHEAAPVRTPRETTWAERLATTSGWLMAPLFALTSALRGSRTFHPDGDLFQADVYPSPGARGAEAAVGARLAGRALVRLSSALLKGAPKYPDVLGCAIRFGDERAGNVQDLLLATIRRPYFLLLAPFFTDVNDYLENDYFGVSPFEVEGLGTRYLRLRPQERTIPTDPELSRTTRIAQDARDGQATFTLGSSESPWGPFADVAIVKLGAASNVDDAALQFVPTRAGRGVSPKGFVHGLRQGVYAASQLARGLTSRPT